MIVFGTDDVIGDSKTSTTTKKSCWLIGCTSFKLKYSLSRIIVRLASKSRQSWESDTLESIQLGTSGSLYSLPVWSREYWSASGSEFSLTEDCIEEECLLCVNSNPSVARFIVCKSKLKVKVHYIRVNGPFLSPTGGRKLFYVSLALGHARLQLLTVNSGPK